MIMRVLYLTDSDITQESGYRVRVLSELTEAVKHGVNVSVLSFQHLRFLLSGAGASEYSRQIRGLGCDVFVVWIIPHFQNRVLRRLVQSYKILWLKRTLTKFHVGLIHSQGLSASRIALMSRSTNHVPIVFDMHSTAPEEARYAHRRSAYVQEVEQAERQVLGNADAVISVSASLNRHIETKYGIQPRKVVVIPCAVDTSLFHFSSKHRDRLRSKWHLADDQPLYVYSGGTQEWQQLDATARLFCKVLRFLPSCKMLLLVPALSRNAAEQSFRLSGAPRESILLCSTDHSRMYELLSAADIGLLIREDLIMNRIASPTKFAEYLGCGLPVVATPYVDSVRDAIRQGGVGFLIQDQTEGSIQQLSNFTKSVVANRERFSKECQKYARDFLSWDCYGDKLAELYSTLLARKLSPYS